MTEPIGTYMHLRNEASKEDPGGPEQRTEEYEITDLPVPQEPEAKEELEDLEQGISRLLHNAAQPNQEFKEAVARFDSRQKMSISEWSIQEYQKQAAEKEAAKEQVKRPSHYDIHPLGIQVIDVIQHLELSFECGNALKYICRAGRKDGNPTVQDLRKAIFYLQLEVEKLNREQT